MQPIADINFLAAQRRERLNIREGDDIVAVVMGNGFGLRCVKFKRLPAQLAEPVGEATQPRDSIDESGITAAAAPAHLIFFLRCFRCDAPDGGDNVQNPFQTLIQEGFALLGRQIVDSKVSPLVIVA